MTPSDPSGSAEIAADLALRLAAAERALVARDKTIRALVTREKIRSEKLPSIFSAMEENTTLQQVVAAKTLELETQNARLSQEIEARIEAEAAQQAQLRFLNTFLNTIPSPVFIKDTEGVYLDCNKVWSEQVMGLPKDQIIGRTGFQLPGAIAPDQAEMYNAKDRWLVQHGGVQIYESEVICADKVRRTFLFTKGVFANAEGGTAGIVGVMLDITARKQAEAELENLHQQLVEASRRGGMAEIATNVLHNVGNVLNSVNVSYSVISDNVRKSHVSSVTKIATLLDDHGSDLADFFTCNPTGLKLPDFLGKLAGRLMEEQTEVLRELQLLGKNIDHIKEIVAMQQSYAKVSGVTEIVNVTDLVEDSLRINSGALTRHRVDVVRDYAEVPPITVDKHKALQILVNLIHNAKHACDDSARTDKQMTVRVCTGSGCVRIAIIDNGTGIPAENLTRIFAHGFTTKRDGHGFGLHSGALAAKEMGGSLTVHSAGQGHGATFTLELPCDAFSEEIESTAGGDDA